jgi:cytochrome c2
MKTYKTLTILLIAVLAVSACENKGIENKQEKEKVVVEDTATKQAVEEPQPVDPRIAKGQRLFDENCTSCHSLHQKIVGPALTGVTKRRDIGWLVAFTRNAPAMIEKGDPIAKKLYAEYKPTIMTVFEFLTDEQIKDIYYYIENEKLADDVKVIAIP